MRPRQGHHPGAHELSRAGDLAGGGTEDQGRPGEDGHRAEPAGAGRPVVPRDHGRGVRADHHLRHGRAAPGNPGRPHAARIRRRGLGRQAAGGVPRNHPPAGARRRGQVHQAVGRARPVRPRGAEPGADAAWRRLRVRRRDQGRGGAARVHPRGRQGHPRDHAVGRAGRLPGGRHQGHAGIRLLPRRRLERKRVPHGRLDGVQGRHAPRPADAAGADDGGRGGNTGGIHRQRDGRSVVTPRHGARHGRHRRRRWQDRTRRSAAGDHVRLLHHAALADAGTRDLHHGVQALRRGARQCGGSGDLGEAGGLRRPPPAGVSRATSLTRRRLSPASSRMREREHTSGLLQARNQRWTKHFSRALTQCG
ncbi:protein of unknown function [Cupriavidus taiwanensis]|nr:protein of unknown function [Cupriavidus taiwanensis]